ncbi:MAG: hypothetical protein FJ267_04025, partial [Planctomycetes bacterium]|nr:hypothetical protein [Planctomycetota bacterium]
MIRSTFILVAAFVCVAEISIGYSAEKSKVLMLTQSKGFKHGSVNRDNKDGTRKDLAPSEVAMTQLGQQT